MHDPLTDRRRLKAGDIDAWLAERAVHREALDKDMRRTCLVALSVLLGGVALCLLIVIYDTDLGLLAGLAAFLGLALCAGLWPRAPLRWARDTDVQVAALVEALRDEMAPGKAMRIDLDLRPYNEAGSKHHRSSPYYRRKSRSYYRDRFLRLRVVLADGTRVRIEMLRKIKEKEDNIEHHHRRATITFEPDTRRYPVRLSRLGNEGSLEHLRKVVRDHIKRAFRDPPEELHVIPRVDNEKNAISLRVVQHDAEILADEVLAVIGVTVDFFDQNARSSA